MNQNVVWKLGLIVAVIALSIFSFYYKGMNLGLDLKGGVHRRGAEPLIVCDAFDDEGLGVLHLQL